MTKLTVRRIEGEKSELVGEVTIDHHIRDMHLIALNRAMGAEPITAQQYEELKAALHEKGINAMLLTLKPGDTIDAYTFEKEPETTGSGVICPGCGDEAVWGSDVDAEDVGCEEPGIISFYTCDPCNISIEVYKKFGESE